MPIFTCINFFKSQQVQQLVTHQSHPTMLLLHWLCSSFLHHRQDNYRCEISGAVNGSTSFVYTALKQILVFGSMQDTIV